MTYKNNLLALNLFFIFLLFFLTIFFSSHFPTNFLRTKYNQGIARLINTFGAHNPNKVTDLTNSIALMNTPKEFMSKVNQRKIKCNRNEVGEKHFIRNYITIYSFQIPRFFMLIFGSRKNLKKM